MPGRERDRGAALERADGSLERRPAGRALLACVARVLEVRGRDERRVERFSLEAFAASGVDRERLRSELRHAASILKGFNLRF